MGKFEDNLMGVLTEFEEYCKKKEKRRWLEQKR